MSADLQTQCALRISDETLSALRDDLLPSTDAERIQAHAATCAACRQRLDDFERVGAALRSQRLAGPSARLWDDVRAAIAAGDRSGRRTHLARGPFRSASRARWSNLGAVAAALLIALLFGLVLRGVLVGNVPTVQPTATTATTATPQHPTPVTPPDWQAQTVPDGITVAFPSASMTVAPSDGDTAYVCGSTTSTGLTGNPHVAVTHDGGAHWITRSDVPLGGQCTTLVVDDTNASIVVAGHTQPINCTTGCVNWQSLYLTTDGGVTWQPFPHGQDAGQQVISLTQLAWSGSGAAYAVIGVASPIIGATPTAYFDTTIHLAVSTDGLRTWRNIDAGIVLDTSLNDQVTHVWRDPSNGHLLVETFATLWTSDDGGATWSPIATPEGLAEYVVERLPDGAGWRICSPLACTTNGGAAWINLPTIARPTQDTGLLPIALTADGALLVQAYIPESNANYIYQLPSGSAHWQDLGPAPVSSLASGAFAYGPSQTGGVIWELPDTLTGFAQFYSAPLPAIG